MVGVAINNLSTEQRKLFTEIFRMWLKFLFMIETHWRHTYLRIISTHLFIFRNLPIEDTLVI